MDYSCFYPMLTAYIQNSPPAPSLATSVAAWMTPVIAGIAVLIAYSQQRIANTQAETARRKLKLDLFARRVIVYDAARTAIGEIGGSGRTNPDIERNFLIGTAGAKFLFEKDIVEFLDKRLWEQICSLGEAQAMTEGAPPSEERKKYALQALEVKTQLNKLLRDIDDIFYDSLSLAH